MFLSCNKDKFQTKPTLKLKSLSDKEIPPNGTLTIRLEYTDKEGDLGNGELTYIRIRTNGTPIPPGNDLVDTIRALLPDYPKKDRGEINIPYSYNLMNEDPVRNDSMYFRITVRDLGGNQSDTITTAIVVARQI